MRRRAPDWPFLAVALGPLLLFGPMLIRGEALFWGTPLLQFVPWRTYAYEVLLQGTLPLWNPMLGMGAPLLANHQSALLYPPNLILPLVGVAWGHALLVALHLAWAGAGAVVLARRLGLNPLGQAVAGISFSLSGFLVSRAGFLTTNAAAAWLPWAVAAADRLVEEATAEGPRTRRALPAASMLALVLALQWLAGHAQTAWYTLCLALAWIGWRAYRTGRWRGIARCGLWTLAAALAALALSAAQLFPTVEYLFQSQRGQGLDPAFAMTYSFWPWRLLGLLAPDAFGNPAHGDYWGYGAYWEDAVYYGVLPLALAVTAVARGLRGQGSHAPLIRFLVAAAASAFALSLGKNLPLFPFLFDNVPTFDLFQAPTRWNLLTVFCLALLAGIGADRWAELSPRAVYWVRLGTAGAASLALAAWIGAPYVPGVRPTLGPAFALAGLWLVVAGALFLWRGWVRHAMGALLPALVVMADLMLAGKGLNPSQPASLYQGTSGLRARTGLTHRLYMPPEVENQIKFHRTHRFDTFSPDVPWETVRTSGLPNTTMLDGLNSANNFDPLLPGRFLDWMEMLGRQEGGEEQRLLSLMDVGWVARLDPAAEGSVRYDQVSSPARARVVPEAIWVDGREEALRVVTAAEFDPAAIVVLEGTRAQEDGRGGAGTARALDSPNPGRVEVEASAPEGGWLLLADTWYPGWRATVDGVDVEVYRADFLFRAVRLPPGEHRVVFRYAPSSFYAGSAVSALAWVLLIVWAVARRRPSS